MSQEEDRVREEIREAIRPLATNYVLSYISNLKQFDEALKTQIDKVDAQIISIKGLRIEAEDQSLPPNKMVCNIRVIGEPVITEQVQAEIRREIEIYSEAQQDMLADNWVKVIGGK